MGSIEIIGGSSVIRADSRNPLGKSCRSSATTTRALLRQRLQPRLDLFSTRLEKRWQREPLAEIFHRLVRRETRLVGRDLEQNPVRLPKIETLEIIAIDRPARRHPHLLQSFRPRVVVA